MWSKTQGCHSFVQTVWFILSEMLFILFAHGKLTLTCYPRYTAPCPCHHHCINLDVIKRKEFIGLKNEVCYKIIFYIRFFKWTVKSWLSYKYKRSIYQRFCLRCEFMKESAKALKTGSRTSERHDTNTQATKQCRNDLLIDTQLTSFPVVARSNTSPLGKIICMSLDRNNLH